MEGTATATTSASSLGEGELGPAPTDPPVLELKRSSSLFEQELDDATCAQAWAAIDDAGKGYLELHDYALFLRSVAPRHRHDLKSIFAGPSSHGAATPGGVGKTGGGDTDQHDEADRHHTEQERRAFAACNTAGDGKLTQREFTAHVKASTDQHFRRGVLHFIHEAHTFH